MRLTISTTGIALVVNETSSTRRQRLLNAPCYPASPLLPPPSPSPLLLFRLLHHIMPCISLPRVEALPVTSSATWQDHQNFRGVTSLTAAGGQRRHGYRGQALSFAKAFLVRPRECSGRGQFGALPSVPGASYSPGGHAICDQAAGGTRACTMISRRRRGIDFGTGTYGDMQAPPQVAFGDSAYGAAYGGETLVDLANMAAWPIWWPGQYGSAGQYGGGGQYGGAAVANWRSCHRCWWRRL